MINRSIPQECVTTPTVHVPTYRTLKYMRQKLKEHNERQSNPLLQLGDINTNLSLIGGSSRKKISKDIIELNSFINQLDLIDIYRIFYSITAEYTYSSRLHEHSPKQMIVCSIKHVSTNLKAQKSYKVCSQNAVELSQKPVTERQLENLI